MFLGKAVDMTGLLADFQLIVGTLTPYQKPALLGGFAISSVRSFDI